MTNNTINSLKKRFKTSSQEDIVLSEIEIEKSPPESTKLLKFTLKFTL